MDFPPRKWPGARINSGALSYDGFGQRQVWDRLPRIVRRGIPTGGQMCHPARERPREVLEQV